MNKSTPCCAFLIKRLIKNRFYALIQIGENKQNYNTQTSLMILLFLSENLTQIQKVVQGPGVCYSIGA